MDKCERCFNIGLSFPDRLFKDLVDKKAKDPKLQAEWDEADEVVAMLEEGEQCHKLWPNPTVVRTVKRTGMRLEHQYAFLTAKEYKKVFKTETKLRKDQLVSVEDEQNLKTLKGILITRKKNDGLEQYRRCTLFSDTVWLLDECLVPEHRNSS
jgi:hypothetical protein